MKPYFAESESEPEPESEPEDRRQLHRISLREVRRPPHRGPPLVLLQHPAVQGDHPSEAVTPSARLVGMSWRLATRTRISAARTGSPAGPSGFWRMRVLIAPTVEA